MAGGELSALAFDAHRDRPRLRKQRGRIARQSVSPVWYWLTHEVIPAEAEPLLDAIRSKLLSGGPQFAEAEVAAFQAAAADIFGFICYFKYISAFYRVIITLI